MQEIRKFNSQNIPKPTCPGDLPKNLSFLDVEIGCGVGFHPIDYVLKNPDRFLVAIEKTSEKFKSFQRRIAGHKNPKNLLAAHTNAIWWVTHYLKPESVDRYFILYPNPYPKDPQKRFFIMPFMEKIIETLKPGGTITLATNEKFYFEESAAASKEIWNLKILDESKVPQDSKPRTHFEKKYLLSGQTCYNLVVQKN